MALRETASGLTLEMDTTDQEWTDEVLIPHLLATAPPDEEETSLCSYLLNQMSLPSRQRVDAGISRTPPAANSTDSPCTRATTTTEDESLGIVVAPPVEFQHQTRAMKRKSRQRAFLTGKVLAKRRDVEARRLLSGEVAPLGVPSLHPGVSRLQGSVA